MNDKYTYTLLYYTVILYKISCTFIIVTVVEVRYLFVKFH